MKLKRSLLFVLFVLVLLCAAAFAQAEAELPTAAVRHGTLVVRIPDSYIDQVTAESEGETDMFGEIAPVTNAETIECIARSVLTGDELTFFLADMQDGDTFPAAGRTALVTPKDYVSIMSSRHCGDAWYSVIRLKEKLAGEQEPWVSIHKYELALTQGELEIRDTGYYVYPITLNIENADDQAALWTNGQVSVYETLGAKLMVQVTPHDPELSDTAADMYISGERLPMWTYLIGYETEYGNDVYCLALTDDEAERVERVVSDGGAPILTAHTY